MSLNSYKLEYTKDWTKPEDFPTYEADEEKVRSDLQLLFDEMRNAFNAFLAGLSASDIPFSQSTAVPESNVQAAIDDVQQQVASQIAGQIPNRSIEKGKIKYRELSNDELDAGAVDSRVLSDEAVVHSKLAADAVEADNVKDGELTADKFAPGVLEIKADLDSNGILYRPQRRWRVIQNPDILNGGLAQHYTLTSESAETLIIFNGETANVTIPLNADAEISVGASVLIVFDGSESLTISPAENVSLLYPPNGVGAFSISRAGVLVLLMKMGLNSWLAIPMLGFLGDGDVIHSKLSAEAVEAENIKAGAVVDGKLAANSVNAANIKTGAVSSILTATILSTYTESESAWTESSGTYTQEIAVEGLVSGTAITVAAAEGASEEASAALGNITFTAADNKLTASSSAEVTVDLPVVITQGEATYNAELPAENVTILSHWSCDGPPYIQDVTVSGIVPVDPEDSTTEVSYSVNSSSEEVIAAFAALSFTAEENSIHVSTNEIISINVPVIVVQNNSSKTFTVPSTGWVSTGLPYKQEVTVAGLLASDTPIVDLVPANTYAVAAKQIDAYSAIYRMTTAENKLTVYATESTQEDIPVQLKVVRK